MSSLVKMRRLALSSLLILLSVTTSLNSLAVGIPNQGPVTSRSKATIFDTCFSPHEACDIKLISFIKKAKSSLDIAIYSITHQGIVDAILSMKNSGIQIRMVVDRTQSKGKSSLVDSLVSNGIQLKIGNFSGIMHDKYTIVDGQLLETGSYNYTANATQNNGENQIYLNDPSVLQRYKDNFNTIWGDALPL